MYSKERLAAISDPGGLAGKEYGKSKTAPVEFTQTPRDKLSYDAFNPGKRADAEASLQQEKLEKRLLAKKEKEEQRHQNLRTAAITRNMKLKVLKIIDDAAEQSIFKEQKDIRSMVNDLVGDMVNSAETQGKANVSAKYNSLKEQMDAMVSQFSFLGKP